MIYICIPTHNEQQTVGVVLWKLRQILTEFHRDYQLLVADDASTDKTPEVLEPYTRVLPLTVIRSDRRLGQAASLEMLLREAVRRSAYPKRDIIVTLQADFSEEPDDVVPMIKRIEAGADLVIGNKVSVTRPTRVRRLARALGTFFSRAHLWPEGVASPFDGYRAYRLYGVRRALEEGGGKRLIRYDGWAGNAELLRAVQPHARRVEVLDVEDRSDRLQRPRRERPMAAAMAVRPMLRGVQPPGLVTVEELDRVAATASRSRAATGRSAQAGTARSATLERGNGRSRQRSGEGGRQPRNGRERAPGRSEPRERGPSRSEARERGGPAPAQSPARPAARPPRPARPAPPARPQAEAEKARGPRPPAAAPNADALDLAALAAAGEAVEQPATPGVEPVGEVSRPKKRRRRRRRGAGGSAATPERAGGEESAGDEPSAVEGGEGGEAGERGGEVLGSSETREPKRRRRRGGRGRRRGPRSAATDAGAAGAAEGEAGAAPEDAPAKGPGVEPVTTPAPAPPAVRDEE